jgi:putative transposase
MPASMTRLFVHYVWGTWQREPWLVGEVREMIFRAILAKCQECDVQVLACNGVEDHLHLLVKMPPTISVAHCIGLLKGVSTYIANHQQPGELFKWQEGYGAFTVSQSGVQNVIAYITNQQAHHASSICHAVMALNASS